MMAGPQDKIADARLLPNCVEGLNPGADLPAQPLSHILRVIGGGQGERIAFAEMVQSLSYRGFSAILIFFAAPNLLPLPPGASTIFGILLIFISLHLIFGCNRLMLPKSIARKSFDCQICARIAHRLGDVFERIESFARPRLWVLPLVFMERLVGLLTLLMALILVLPIPLGNFLPAVAIVVLNLGLCERNGLWLCAGALISAMSVGIALGVIHIAGTVAIYIF